MAYESPELAEQAFYKAFEEADVDSMMSVWSPIGSVLCIHPMGPALTALDVIRASWLEIFAAPVNHRIDIELLSDRRAATVCVRTVIERFSIPGQREQFAPIIARNVFWRGDRGWYLVTHHGGPARNQTASDEPSSEQTRH